MEKENDKIILKKISINLVFLISFVLYFGITYFLLKKIDNNLILKIYKYSSLFFLLCGIIFMEISYCKKNIKLAINSVELIFLAIYILICEVIIKKLNISYDLFSILSLCLFMLYYLFKISIIYTNEKRKYANSFSDIHEILNNDPIKKEAQKRGKN